MAKYRLHDTSHLATDHVCQVAYAHESVLQTFSGKLSHSLARKNTETKKQGVVIYQCFSIFVVGTGGPAHELAEAWHGERLTLILFTPFLLLHTLSASTVCGCRESRDRAADLHVLGKGECEKALRSCRGVG